MFGLAQKIRGAHLGIHGVVGQQQRFGWPGRQVDADASVQLPLGLGNERISRADEHVDRLDELGSQGHGGHRLHPAQQIDLVGATEVHGRNGLGRNRALDRRCAGRHSGHASHLGGDDAHVSGGDHGIPPAGHIGADVGHGDVLVAQRDSRQGLDLHIGECLALGLREVPDLRLGEPDVVENGGVDAGHGAVDFLIGELKRLR